MTIRAVSLAAAAAGLTACGWLAHARPDAETGSPYPFYWAVRGGEERSIDFAGLPIQRDRTFMFYEQHFGRTPRIWVSHVSGRTSFENGGIPQRTDWAAHLSKIRSDIAAVIPDPNWDGYGILDFETWLPFWAYLNEPMREESRKYVRERYQGLTAAQVEQKAREEFEAAGLDFLIRTVNACKAERPRAKWGYYGYPYPFTPEEAQRIRPLYEAVDAAFPPVYAIYYSVPDGQSLAAGQKPASNYIRLIDGHIARAREAVGSKPVIALIWARYHDMNQVYSGQWLNDIDWATILSRPYVAGAQGSAFWEAAPSRTLAMEYSGFFAGRGGDAMRAFIQSITPAARSNEAPAGTLSSGAAPAQESPKAPNRIRTLSRPAPDAVPMRRMRTDNQTKTPDSNKTVDGAEKPQP